jgi:uncharacterized membrane protein YfhO
MSQSNLQTTVFLEKYPPELPAPERQNRTRKALVHVEHFDLDTLETEVQIEDGHPRWLVFVDSFYPGWKASLDGIPTEIFRADYNFKAILVPPGRHRASFVFAPTTYAVGLALRRITFALLLLWLSYFLLYRKLSHYALSRREIMRLDG